MKKERLFGVLISLVLISLASASALRPDNCNDSDDDGVNNGIDYYVKGLAIGVPNPLYDWTGGATHIEAYDLCVMGQVYEHYCDDEGYIRREVVVCKNGCGDGACIWKEGCDIIGLRDNRKYCGLGSQWEDQKQEGRCQNNFECRGNFCLASECVDEGLLIRIINWFKRFFGHGNQIE